MGSGTCLGVKAVFQPRPGNPRHHAADRQSADINHCSLCSRHACQNGTALLRAAKRTQCASQALRWEETARSRSLPVASPVTGSSPVAISPLMTPYLPARIQHLEWMTFTSPVLRRNHTSGYRWNRGRRVGWMEDLVRCL